MTSEPPAEEPPDEPMPGAMSYVRLNLGVWAFLGLCTVLWARLLDRGDGMEWRGLWLFSLILAFGFSAVSLFDYLWLRFGRRD